MTRTVATSWRHETGPTTRVMGRSGWRRMRPVINAISEVMRRASISRVKSGLPAEPPTMTMTPARQSPAAARVARPGVSRIHPHAMAAAAKGAVAWMMATLATTMPATRLSPPSASPRAAASPPVQAMVRILVGPPARSWTQPNRLVSCLQIQILMEPRPRRW